MADVKQEPVSTQPKGTIAMSVDGNKNALNRPIGEDGKREWSYDIVDPSGWGCRTCCFVTWCPCMIYSRNRQHLRSLQIEGTPLPAGNERTIDANCCIYSGLRVVSLHWTLQIGTRREIRDRYGIRGNACDDCITSYFCLPRALVQERREIELEESSFL